MAVYTDVAAAQADGVLHHWTFDDFSLGYFPDRVGDWHAQARNPSAYDVNSAIVAGVLDSGLDTTAASPDATVFNQYIHLDLPVTGRTPLVLGAYTIRYRHYWREFIDLSSIGYPEILKLGNWDPDVDWLNNSSKAVYLFRDNSSGNHVSAFMYSGSGIYRTTAHRPRGTWSDIVITTDGTNLKTYTDGVVENSWTLTNTAELDLYAQEGRLGYVYDPDVNAANDKYMLDGVIDEVTIWNRMMTDAEIAALYSGGSPLELVGVGGPSSTPAQYIDDSAPAFFTATLTGGPDSLPDLELPMSSFSVRNRSGRESYLSYVVPHGSQYVDAIAARPSGELVVELNQSAGVVELARVNYETLRSDSGANAGETLTLTGHKQTTNDSPGDIAMDSTTYLSVSGSDQRIRGSLVTNIRPGDTVVSGSLSFVVDTVTINGNAAGVTMELSA